MVIGRLAVAGAGTFVVPARTCAENGNRPPASSIARVTGSYLAVNSASGISSPFFRRTSTS